MESLYSIYDSPIRRASIIIGNTAITIKNKKRINQRKNLKKVHFAENISFEYTYSPDIYDRTPIDEEEEEEEKYDEYYSRHSVSKSSNVYNIIDEIDFEIIYNNVYMTIQNKKSSAYYVDDAMDDDQDSVIDFDDFDDFDDDFDEFSF